MCVADFGGIISRGLWQGAAEPPVSYRLSDHLPLPCQWRFTSSSSMISVRRNNWFLMTFHVPPPCHRFYTVFGKKIKRLEYQPPFTYQPVFSATLANGQDIDTPRLKQISSPIWNGTCHIYGPWSMIFHPAVAILSAPTVPPATPFWDAGSWTAEKSLRMIATQACKLGFTMIHGC